MTELDWKSVEVENDVTLIRFNANGRILSQEDVFHLLATSAEFAQLYSSVLLIKGGTGFCWETPPITTTSLSQENQCVVVRSHTHSKLKQDPTPFDEHFRKVSPKALAVSFPSLRKDALMIAPTPAQNTNYAHLASFLATATTDQILSLWRLAATETLNASTASPHWLSTAGLGVSWLHIRLDTNPKYYRYAPYREQP